MRSRVLFSAATVVLLGCIDFTPPPELPKVDPFRNPGSIVITPASRKFVRSGSEQFRAVILDHLGEPVPTFAVTWTSSDNEVLRVSSSGLATPRSFGNAKVIARFDHITASADVIVDFFPTDSPIEDGTVCSSNGGGQTGPVMQPLPQPIVIYVCDSTGALPGARIQFTAIAGQVADTAVTTDAGGYARTSWTLGARAGDQTLRVTGPNYSSFLMAHALPLQADAVVKLTGDVSGILSGDPVAPPPSVRVEDRYGNAVSNVRVNFVRTRGGGQITGEVQYTVAGVARLGSWIVDTAAVQEVTASVALDGIRGNPVTFRANVERRGAPAHIITTSETSQSGPAGYAVMSAPAVIVKDDQNHLLRDVPVTFTVTSGGGSVQSVVITDGSGVARTSWTIGSGSNTLVASVAGIATPVTFSATGVTPAFTIDLRYIGDVSPAVRAAFDAAAVRWSQLIYGDLPDLPVQAPAGICGRDPLPAMAETIDDIVVYVMVESIDGYSGTQFTSGPCYVRDGSLLPAIAYVRFDSADLGFFSSPQLAAAARHSLAHALGFGSLWNPKGLVSGSGTSLPRYLGAQAITGWHAVGGLPGITAIPAAADGGGVEGITLQRDAHWSRWFSGELMSPFNSASMALASTLAISVVTAGQFVDLGYLVNMRLVDAYQCALNTCINPPNVLAGSTALANDISTNPLVVVDRAGRVVRTLPALMK